jgi:hypothetical protein
MNFRLLGPLEGPEQGRSLALGGVKQRSLLAVSCFSWSLTTTPP